MSEGTVAQGSKQQKEAAAEPVAPRGRIAFLDNLRGLALLNMVVYHGLYDLVYIFGVPLAWYSGRGGFYWQQWICWTFILVSGATSHYNHHPYRRGILVLACGLLVTCGTALAVPAEAIYFGILHFLGTAMLLTACCRRGFAHVKPWLGACAALLLFTVTAGVPAGYVGLPGHPFLLLPHSWYQGVLGYPLGFAAPGLYVNDYFSLFPWLFLYWLGYFGWPLISPRLQQRSWLQKPWPYLGYAGRHTLLVYLAHQPLLYGICLLLAGLGILS